MTRELLNTLFVQTPHAYVRLEGETLVVQADGTPPFPVPMHHLGAVMVFGTAQVSGPALARCAKDGRAVCAFDFAGRFQWRVVGPTGGNVLLRQAQHDAHRDPARCVEIARAVVGGKIRNVRGLLGRSARDVKRDEAADRLREAADTLAELLAELPTQGDVDAIRGVEGQAAAVYFAVLDALLAVPTEEFSFRNRSRRPPRDRVNALLSFLYALLAADCVAACEGVGLDPQIGFLHATRPGRPSLALDLMEEFRPLLAERLAFTLINRRQLLPKHFEERADAGESVLLTAEGRKIVLGAYQERKKEEVIHPLLKDKAPLGLLPHLQARLLARHLRGDLRTYPPFPA